jgi:hypothetical protein
MVPTLILPPSYGARKPGFAVAGTPYHPPLLFLLSLVVRLLPHLLIFPRTDDGTKDPELPVPAATPGTAPQGRPPQKWPFARANTWMSVL